MGRDPPIPDPPPDPPFFDFEDLQAVLLGGSIHAIAETVEERNEGAIHKLLEGDWDLLEVATRGASQALEAFADRYHRSSAWFETTGKTDQQAD